MDQGETQKNFLKWFIPQLYNRLYQTYISRLKACYEINKSWFEELGFYDELSTIKSQITL